MALCGFGSLRDNAFTVPLKIAQRFNAGSLKNKKDEVPSGTTETSFGLRHLIPRRDSFVPKATVLERNLFLIRPYGEFEGWFRQHVIEQYD